MREFSLALYFIISRKQPNYNVIVWKPFGLVKSELFFHFLFFDERTIWGVRIISNMHTYMCVPLKKRQSEWKWKYYIARVKQIQFKFYFVKFAADASATIAALYYHENQLKM